MNQYPTMYPQYANAVPQMPQYAPQQQPVQQQQFTFSESQPLNAPAPQASSADAPSSTCPFSRFTRHQCQCRFSRRLMKNADKKLVISMLAALLLSAPLSVMSTGFGFVIALIPKCMAFALGFSTTRPGQNSELSQGIFFGFQMFSMLFTLALGFNGFFSFLMAMLVLFFEAFSLVFSGKMACDAAKANRAAREATAQPEDASMNEDVVDNVVAAPEQPAQVFQEVYPQMPQNYGAYAQPAPQPMQYQQQPAQVSQQPELEALFQKYSVQLNLLAEMSFTQTYQDKARNARLLEKYNGNIQQVVGELVKSQH